MKKRRRKTMGKRNAATLSLEGRDVNEKPREKRVSVEKVY